MTERVEQLRAASLQTQPYLSAERAQLMTNFYRENRGKLSTPRLRARAFLHLCKEKTIYIGSRELIVGERGPAPKATPTYPEITCHSSEDLQILNDREKTAYRVAPEVLRIYAGEIIPYWRGRSMRDRIFNVLSEEWQQAYAAGIFTEFMEQRAPGHTVADGKIYKTGMLGFKRQVAAALARLDFSEDATAAARREQLAAMALAADAAILFARRHAALAREQAIVEVDTVRRTELRRIAEICERVPAEPPRDFHEALQMYWFCHLAVITELNGWDSFSPGHLDQHLDPFYRRGIAEGTLTRQQAKELLECLFIKFNNHPAPPKVGVTAAESGTYTDFATINIGGLRSNGEDGTCEVSHLMLDVIEELHILQPSHNVQISRKTPEALLRAAGRVIRRGWGYPSLFNADGVVGQLMRQGKDIADARAGGTSGCVESGAFGKEAYILTGYLNFPRILELTLNNGQDPRTGEQLGPGTGAADDFASFEDLFAAYAAQLRHFVDIKIAGNRMIEALYAELMPAPFLSLITSDCIANGSDYHAGGARYNTAYIQGVGIGTLTDSFAAIRKYVYQERKLDLAALRAALASDFADREALRQMLRNRAPKWGNDDDDADHLMRRAFDVFFEAVDGRPTLHGGRYHIDMLPTTCHVYFGAVTGATPDGRHAGQPLSEGISPVQGMDREGPTAVFLSAAKMDHARTGGTLLNMKFTPAMLSDDAGIAKWAGLVRTYFGLGGHHVQFNVVDAETLRAAQAAPEEHRNLLVRVAGYSDYFCDLSRVLQDEIISRTAQSGS